MKLRQLTAVTLIFAALAAAGCANTVRGVGRDAANTVNAVEGAGSDVAKAAQ